MMMEMMMGMFGYDDLLVVVQITQAIIAKVPAQTGDKADT